MAFVAKRLQAVVIVLLLSCLGLPVQAQTAGNSGVYTYLDCGNFNVNQAVPVATFTMGLCGVPGFSAEDIPFFDYVPVDVIITMNSYTAPAGSHFFQSEWIADDPAGYDNASGSVTYPTRQGQIFIFTGNNVFDAHNFRVWVHDQYPHGAFSLGLNNCDFQGGANDCTSNSYSFNLTLGYYALEGDTGNTPTPTAPPIGATNTPTATPGPSPTPRPTSTRGVIPTGAVPSSTPIPVAPTPTPPDFNNDPDYASPPTRIPDLDLPETNGLFPEPPQRYPLPNIPDYQLPPLSEENIQPVVASLGLSYPTPAAPEYGKAVEDSPIYTQVLAAEAVISQATYGILTATETISAQLAMINEYGDTMSLVSTVPDDYAPTMPRPMAQVGWRFEEMASDVRRRFSIHAWIGLIANMIALPVQFIKSLWLFTEFSGPLRLIMAWGFIMMPIALLFKFSGFLRDAIIWLARTAWELFRFLVSLIPGVG